MFINMSNDLFPASLNYLKQLRVSEKERHPSYQRLYSVAVENNIRGPSELAVALGESEQVINNWSRRGVSNAGAIKAQERFGCSSVWILKGVGPEAASTVVTANHVSLPEANYLQRLLAAIPEARRQQAYIAATQLLIGYLETNVPPAIPAPKLPDHPANKRD